MGFFETIGNIAKGTAKIALDITSISLEGASRDRRFSDEEKDWALDSANKLRDLKNKF